MRVVPESSGSSWRIDNFALYLASESGADFSALRYGDHADVPGSPVSHTLQLRDEQGIIGGIVASGGESRRVDSRRSTERWNLQAGVLREKQPIGALGVISGLQRRVLLERRAGFLWRQSGGDQDNFDVSRRQLKLPQLAGVSCRHQ